jgi:hypothetical protein
MVTAQERLPGPEGARLDGADLREIPTLTQEQLNSAYGSTTWFPDELQRPDGWHP